MINWDEFNLYLGKELGRDFILELIGDFVRGNREQMLILKKNVKEKDFPQVQINAHTLKTHCATFGDLEAKALAFKLEIMGKERRDDDMEGTYDVLANAVENLVNELKKY